MFTSLCGYLNLAATGLSASSTLAIGVTILFAYAIYGMSGFGSSIVAVPLLTQLIPLRTVTPIMLLLDLVVGTLLGTRNRSAVQMGELYRLGPWILIGMVLGVMLLTSSPELPLELLLGVAVVLYSSWRITSRQAFRELSRTWACPFGMVGGCFTAIFGTGGPLYTLYLGGRLRSHEQFRATISLLITLTAIARLVMFTLYGLLGNPVIYHLTLWLLPCAIGGLVVGARLRGKIPAQSTASVVWGILIFSGGSLIVHAVSGMRG